MTTDGLYLDEMFKDVRVTQQADAYLIGGECFGGFFGRSKVKIASVPAATRKATSAKIKIGT